VTAPRRPRRRALSASNGETLGDVPLGGVEVSHGQMRERGAGRRLSHKARISAAAGTVHGLDGATDGTDEIAASNCDARSQHAGAHRDRIRHARVGN